MSAENQNKSPLRILTDAVKGWVKLLLLLVGLLCFLAGGWWLYCLKENHLGRKEWGQVKAELEAKGEIMDWESIVEEPVPDELNFAKAPIIEPVLIREQGNSSRIDWLDWKARHIHPHSGNPYRQERTDFSAMVIDIDADPEQSVEWTVFDPAERIRDWVAFAPAIERQLVEAARRPETRYQPERFDGAIPNYVRFRVLAQRVGTLALAELETSNPDRALDILRVNFAVSRGFHESQTLIVGSMIGGAIDGLSTAVIWEGLANHRWNEEQLVRLDLELSRRDLLAAIQDGMRFERLVRVDTFRDTEAVFRHFSQTQLIGSRSVHLNPMFYGSKLLPDGWAYRSRAAYARFIQESAIAFYDRETRIADPSIIARADAQARENLVSGHPRDRFVTSTLPRFSKTYLTCGRNQVQMDHARIAIAIERFRLRNEELPRTLNDLSPEFIDNVPHDLIGGAAYSYRRLTESEYMLWGVGWNEIDEDGLVSGDKETGDWVWFSFAEEQPQAPTP